jgi:hypothetical protein
MSRPATGGIAGRVGDGEVALGLREHQASTGGIYWSASVANLLDRLETDGFVRSVAAAGVTVQVPGSDSTRVIRSGTPHAQ